MTNQNLPAVPAEFDDSHPAVKQELLIGMAAGIGLTMGKFWATMLTVCPPEATTEDILSFLVVANEYGLNPLTKEIYLVKSKGGKVLPVVGYDGWTNLREKKNDCDGLTFEDRFNPAGELVAITARLFRKEFTHPFEVTEYMVECNRAAEDNFNPWNKWPRRMLRNKAKIQVERMAYGFSGIYDPDESERIVALDASEYSVTDGAGQANAEGLGRRLAERSAVAEARRVATREALDTADPVDPEPEADGMGPNLAAGADGSTVDPGDACEICGNTKRQLHTVGNFNVCYKCKPEARTRSGVDNRTVKEEMGTDAPDGTEPGNGGDNGGTEAAAPRPDMIKHYCACGIQIPKAGKCTLCQAGDVPNGSEDGPAGEDLNPDGGTPPEDYPPLAPASAGTVAETPCNRCKEVMDRALLTVGKDNRYYCQGCVVALKEIKAARERAAATTESKRPTLAELRQREKENKAKAKGL